jgi:hypothetical protein
MITPNASNWVFRGEPPEPTLARILGSYLELDAERDATRLGEVVAALRGMADADATEIQIAGYLHTLEEQLGITDRIPRHRRTMAIAVWHIAKCAEVRDRALKLLEAYRGAAT